jgi:hypothetical protein
MKPIDGENPAFCCCGKEPNAFAKVEAMNQG